MHGIFLVKLPSNKYHWTLLMIRKHWFSKGIISSGNKPLPEPLLTQSSVHEELMIRFDLFFFVCFFVCFVFISRQPSMIFGIDFIDQMTSFKMSDEASQIRAILEKLRIDIFRFKNARVSEVFTGLFFVWISIHFNFKYAPFALHSWNVSQSGFSKYFHWIMLDRGLPIWSIMIIPNNGLAPIKKSLPTSLMTYL